MSEQLIKSGMYCRVASRIAAWHRTMGCMYEICPRYIHIFRTDHEWAYFETLDGVFEGKHSMWLGSALRPASPLEQLALEAK